MITLGQFAGAFVGHRDDGGVGHRGVAAQEGLEFGRGHLESFDLDEFLARSSAKAQYHVNGTVNGCRVRVIIAPGDSGWA